ncbi:MAG: hypothetical protein ABI361_14040 [Nitrososphaera sp.]
MVNKGADARDEIKHCPLCGCTEHRLIGCSRHLGKHKQDESGRCIVE